MERKVKTVAHYLKTAQGKSQHDFIADFPDPVIIEKIGVFPHEHPSLLAGTVVVDSAPELVEFESELTDQDIRNAKVFTLRKRPSSMGPDIFIGRAPTNDIVLKSSSVSKTHAQISPTADGEHYQLADKFSSNGTFLNGQKLHPFEKHEVKDRDQIGFGPDYLLIYYSPPAFYELLISLRI